MRRILLSIPVCLLVPVLPVLPQASALDRPPAGQEDALRERVMTFYTLHKEGKFRQAETYVCADSKDAYYDAEKRRWRSVQINQIVYENDFKTAKVLVALGTEMRTRGNVIPALYPYNSIWHLENNEWCHHLPPPAKAETITPFGIMKSTPVRPEDEGKPRPPIVGMPPLDNPEAVLNLVKLSKRQMLVKGYEASSDQIEIENGMPGELNLDVQGPRIETVQWSLSKKRLASGEHAIFKVTHEPTDKSIKPDLVLRLVIDPIGQVIPVRVVFDVPAELKKQLPPPQAAKP